MRKIRERNLCERMLYGSREAGGRSDWPEQCPGNERQKKGRPTELRKIVMEGTVTLATMAGIWVERQIHQQRGVAETTELWLGYN
jgi:hypothetical protein